MGDSSDDQKCYLKESLLSPRQSKSFEHSFGRASPPAERQNGKISRFFESSDSLRLSKSGSGSGSGPGIEEVGSGEAIDDDDSNQLFMSEPSMSEADSTENHMRLLSPSESFSEENDDLLPPPPPPMPRQSSTAFYAVSPGNTSLSSWESPHTKGRKVRMHFSPESPERKEGILAPAPKDDAQPSASNGQNGDIKGDKVSEDSSRGNDVAALPKYNSPQNEREKMENFLHGLRSSSLGKMEESTPGGYSSLESSHKPVAQHNMENILRRAPAPDTANPTSNHSRVQEESRVATSSPTTRMNPTNAYADDTVIMTLSESEDEGDEKDGISPTFNANRDELESSVASDEQNRPLDWEQQHSADDEKTTRGYSRNRTRPNPAHRRSRSGDASTGHRRQRSGDSAAANLLIGGSNDWRGMEQDNIPLPSAYGDDDEDSKTSEKQHPFNSNNAFSSLFGEESDSSVNDASGFRIGSGGAQGKQRRKRRDSKSRRGDQFLSVDTGTTTQHDPGSPGSALFSHNWPARGEMNLLPREDYRTMPVNQSRSATFTGNVTDFSHSPTTQWGNMPIGNHYWIPPSPSPSLTASMAYMGAPPPPSPAALSPRSQFMASVQEQWSESARQSTRKQPSPQYLNNSHTGHLPAESPGSHIHQRSSYGSMLSGSPYSRISSSERNLQQGGEQYRGVIFHSERSPLWTNSSHTGSEIAFQDSSAHPDSSDDDTRSGSSSSRRSDSAASSHDIRNNKFSPMAVLRGRQKFGFGTESDSDSRRRRFLPMTSALGEDEDDPNSSTYICPGCKTRQREFFTVSNAPRKFESASGYIAGYFGIYVVAALYLFGLQEKWPAIDCVYFAVITLTTAGLGDFTPSSDGAKISCSIFIYFGVACIGLLLGTYIASMLDESSNREAKENRRKACPNCANIKNIRDAAERRHSRTRGFSSASTHDDGSHMYFSERTHDSHHIYEPDTKKFKRQHHDPHDRHTSTPITSLSERAPLTSTITCENTGGTEVVYTSPAVNGHKKTSSPFTSQMLGRQNHTKHASLDLRSDKFLPTFSSRARKFSAELPATIEENGATEGESIQPQHFRPPNRHSDTDDEEENLSYFSGYSTGSERRRHHAPASENQFINVKNAKYVFLTLKEAIVNSMVIIAFGCLGFYFIEGFSIVDSWYFTTVLLTTVGYGDLVPVTNGGKLFATVYILVAGTILLNNMSMISMIPLELRKRRIELAVLTQFGDQLDDAALRELATGALVQRLKLSVPRPDGLNECTREMFALAMLVRLGKVTEEDIRSTFDSFNRLDVNGDGVLNSGSIIAGMIQKRRTQPKQPQRQSMSTPQHTSMFGNHLHDFGQRMHPTPVGAFSGGPPTQYNGPSQR